MIKILFYNHTGKVSGAEKMLLITLAGLDRRRFKSLVLCPGDGPLATTLNQQGIETKVCPPLGARFTLRVDLLAKYILSSFKVARTVRSIIRENNPDFVHANSIRAGLVATVATFGLGTKVTWHLHDLLPRHPVSTAIRLIALFFARTQMIAVSRAVANNFAGKFSSLRKRTRVVLNGIDLDPFKFVIGRRSEARRQLNLNESEFVVGIVGLLTPRKGQLELIRSFANVVAEVPEARLVIVGGAVFNKDHEYADELKQTVSRLGLTDHVSFLGPRNDVPEIMHALDLLVMNSSVEPFGLVVIEAMASGTPIVAAVSGGIPEIIEHQKSGLLVDNGNQAMLAEAIVTLAKNDSLRAQLARAGKQRACSFTSSRYLAELENFYLTSNTKRVAKRSQVSTVASQAAPKTAC